MIKDEALKMAIVVMQTFDSQLPTNSAKEAIQACKEALEQRDLYSEIKEGFDALKQPAQEPVACMFVSEEGGCEEIGHLEHHYDGEFPDDFTPLYTHPTSSWQGLSDDEIKLAITTALDINVIDITKEEIVVAHAIETKLKEKNT